MLTYRTRLHQTTSQRVACACACVTANIHTHTRTRHNNNKLKSINLMNFGNFACHDRVTHDQSHHSPSFIHAMIYLMRIGFLARRTRGFQSHPHSIDTHRKYRKMYVRLGGFWELFYYCDRPTLAKMKQKSCATNSLSLTQRGLYIVE